MITVFDFRRHVESVDASMVHFRANHQNIDIHQLKCIFDMFPNTSEGNRELAQALWRNNHWIRAKFLRMMASRFEEMGITDQQSLAHWLRKADFDKDVHGRFRTAEHSMAIIIFNWLALRSGIPTVKPDIHVLRFVETAIGRRPSLEDTITALRRLANELGMETFRLDSAIWHVQRDGYIPAEELQPDDAATSPDDVRVGSIVLVVSSYDGEEYPGKVIEIDHDRIKVTFPGWGRNWDENLPFSTIRFPENHRRGMG